MALIKSISGIRGTIGGAVADNLTPLDLVIFTSAYAHWIKSINGKKVIIGRDARISGPMVANLVSNTLMACGIDVVDIGLTTTPTLAMSVIEQSAHGGVVITASHNPKHWNALKFLDENGCFLDHKAAHSIINMDPASFTYAKVEELGTYTHYDGAVEDHIKAILSLPFLDIKAIRQRAYKVVVDCINSTGAISIMPLMTALGCEVISMNAEMHGDFQHPAEPLPQHLTALSEKVLLERADFGIAVDPDVDRICFVCEDGSFFGEENTIVAASDFILSERLGPIVSNLSSSRALWDLADQYKVDYFASAVGELNVVLKMKSVNAVIGGEGNGGVILPDLHYGRDGLVGAALFSALLAKKNVAASTLKASYPSYFMIKDKVQLPDRSAITHVLEHLQDQPSIEKDTQDGLKLYFADSWVHLRASNTEPILRIYTEAKSPESAQKLAEKYKEIIVELL